MGTNTGLPGGQRKLGFLLLRRLLGFLGKGFWVTSAIVLVAALLDGAGLLALAPLLAAASDEENHRWWNQLEPAAAALGVHGPQEKIILATALFAMIMLSRAIVIRIRDLRLVRHNHEFVDHLRLDLVRAMAGAPWRRLPASRRSELEHGILNDIRRVQTGSNQTLRSFATATMLIAQLVAAVLISWRLALVSFAVLLPLTIALRPIILAARHWGSATTSAGRHTHEWLSRFLSGLKLYKAHGREFEFVESYAQSNARLREHSLSFARSQSDAEFLITVGAGAILVAITLTGLFWLGLPIADIAVFALIFARLSRSFFSLVRGAQSFAHMLPAFDNLLMLEREFEKSKPHFPTFANSVLQSEAEGVWRRGMEVVAEAIHYTFDGGASPILRDVSFRIAPGQMVALIGPSGAGKTTLLDALTGLIAPQQGSLLLDGRDVRETIPDAVRDRISYVPQEAPFFDGSLRENLQSLSGPRDDRALWRALELAAADRIPAIADMGLDVRMMDLGQRFSGGERQRLGLARAILREPTLLLLDEAMSAIETSLERRILQAIAGTSSPPTVVLVAHRIPHGIRFDQILHLDHGSLEGRLRA